MRRTLKASKGSENSGWRVAVLLAILGASVAPASAQVDRGRIVGWGAQVVGVSDGSDFVAIAAGYGHSLGLRADGSIVAWGDNGYGQCDVPAPNAGFVAVAAGGFRSLGIRGYPRADLDQNGDGNLDDLTRLLKDFDCLGGGCVGDADGDGDTDLDDLMLLLGTFDWAVP